MMTMEGEKVERPFKVKHFELLLKWCKALKIDPRYPYNRFHRDYSYYSRRQDTINLLNKAYRHDIITGPTIFANSGIEVEFYSEIDDPFVFLEECMHDGETTLAYALYGDWSFIRFKKGANMLEYVDSILPNFFSKNDFFIENILIKEKGILPRDQYPHGWLDEHWKIYHLMGAPREHGIMNIVKKIELSYETFVKFYKEVLFQCKVLSGFFPLTQKGYSLQLLTFRTEYEIGILKALEKLNRTSFIYKVNGIIILILHLIPRPMDFNISTRKFYDLQEKGYIRDLHVCTPIEWDHY